MLLRFGGCEAFYKALIFIYIIGRFCWLGQWLVLLSAGFAGASGFELC